MTTYNLVVTMGPNIMRRMREKNGDFVNHGAMYEALITMIDNYEELFEDVKDEESSADQSAKPVR